MITPAKRENQLKANIPAHVVNTLVLPGYGDDVTIYRIKVLGKV